MSGKCLWEGYRTGRSQFTTVTLPAGVFKLLASRNERRITIRFHYNGENFVSLFPGVFTEQLKGINIGRVSEFNSDMQVADIFIARDLCFTQATDGDAPTKEWWGWASADNNLVVEEVFADEYSTGIA